jgi:glycosyltransferase involved in cell wall biosynthesis
MKHHKEQPAAPIRDPNRDPARDAAGKYFLDAEEDRRPLRVCFFGTYRANYMRNQILLFGLRRQPGVQVLECHATLWHGIEDRVAQASGGWRRPRFWFRVLAAYWKLLVAHRHLPAYDVMLIGYPGQFDVYLGRLLTWRRRKPLALDILMSLHLIAEERGLVTRHPFTGRLLFWLEKGGLKLPDLLIADTVAYAAYYRDKYGLRPSRLRLVPMGADDRLFYPRAVRPPDDSFHVTYHGTFLPSHGLETIIRAAALLRRRPDIRFHFYGTGPELTPTQAWAEQEGLNNVVFHGHVAQELLPDALARSHLILGVFGATPQALMTVQNKIWEGLALARPVVSGDSATVREILVHGEHIYLVPRQDPQALSAAIVTLQEDSALRERLALAAYERYRAANSIEATGRKTAAVLRELSR